MTSISRWTRSLFGAAALLAVSLAWPVPSQAQRITAELSGTVADSTGAVVPGADVVLKNEGSGDVRRGVTNSEGFFSFASVPAQTYSLTVSLQGFKSYEVKGVALHAGDSRAFRQIKLEVSTLAETVTVQAEVALTPLNSGERSATLGAEQIENIPIVSSSAAELIRILPGMTPNTRGVTNQGNFTGEVIGINGNGEYSGGGNNNQSAIGNYSANGSRLGSVDITLDGAPGADPGCNCATSVNPNTEMVQEFKILSASFSAEYAKGPNAMQVVTKQGGRQFHGSLFTYYRDYHLNSNDWLQNQAGKPRTQNKFVYPGGTLSGPIVQDKVFFFAGFEYYKQRLDTGVIRSWVPTAEMRNGDFSNPGVVGSGSFVNTPVTGFPGGIIPSGAQDPGGRTLLNVFPQPNANPATTRGYNYFDNVLVEQPNKQFLTRIDFNISDSTKMFVRYNLQRETQPWVVGLWWRNGENQVPYPSTLSAPNRSDSGTIALTHVFDPTLTSETIFGTTFINFPNTIDDRSKVSRQALGYPYQGVFGQSNDQIPSVFVNGGGPIYFNPGGFDPILFAKKWQFNFAENITKVWGTHAAKLGFYFERITNDQPGNGNSNGSITEDRGTATSTGNGFADLLLGRVGSYNEQTKNVLHNIAWNRFEFYAQDTWKVKPNVTLNFGARVSSIAPWEDREGRGVVVFDLARYNAAPPGTQFPGITYNALDSSVPLSGVGKNIYVQPRVGFAWDLKGTGDTVVRGGAGIYYSHDAQQPYDQGIDFGAGVKSFGTSGSAGTTLTALEGLGNRGAGNVGFGGAGLDITDDKQPKTYSWSLTLNQKLPWAMNVEVGYVGNSSKNLMNFDVANYNAVPLNGTTRPLNGFGDLNVYRHSSFQNYHGLQTLLARQRGNFNFTLAYTFSKALGIMGNTGGTGGGGPNPGSEYVLDARSSLYGILSYDRTHVATTSYSWMLPGPKGGAAEAILGGWQVAGITSYVSGSPLPNASGSINFNMTGTLAGGAKISNQLINGSPQISAQPVLTCDPKSGVPSGFMFNPACFAAPSPGANGSYMMPYMTAQSYFNNDLSLFKNFKLGGDKKLQFRVSAYNVLNHPTKYPTTNNNLTLTFANGVRVNNDFGKLPDDNKFGRRIVQLALRFMF